ncbi:hypothetical protein [Deinococcus metalli]|nr:hypothetical protein [Deinococcus metalli]GHF58350.1 hypothetical protein GCM10017781_38290 [Deinococcus metalli]
MLGLLAATALTAALSAAWWQAVGRWSMPLYCIQQRGTVWGGLFETPAGLTPVCPTASTYRTEVRTGQSRVEQYTLPTWAPDALLTPLTRAGYVLREDEIRGPGHYSAFLGRTVPAELFYTAVRDGSGTLITISGSP